MEDRVAYLSKQLRRIPTEQNLCLMIDENQDAVFVHHVDAFAHRLVDFAYARLAFSQLGIQLLHFGEIGICPEYPDNLPLPIVQRNFAGEYRVNGSISVGELFLKACEWLV